MLTIWKAAMNQCQKGNDFVLATITAVAGSSPRHIGTRFLVRKDGSSVGTIGGGQFEANVLGLAARALKRGVSRRVKLSFRGTDASSTQMICGGEAEVLVEVVRADKPEIHNLFRYLVNMSLERSSGFLFTQFNMEIGQEGPVAHLLIDDNDMAIGGFANSTAAVQAIPHSRLLQPAQLLDVAGFDQPILLEWIHPEGTAIIFGAGHVGACVAHLASYLGLKVVVLDDREEFASAENLPDADQVVILDAFENAFDHVSVNADSYLVIVTRGHAYDKTVLGLALRTPATYIGMIGSRRKIKLIFQGLLEEGFTQDDIQRVNAPIGLPIGGETPQEIAISIVAEIIQVRNRKDRMRTLGS